MSSDWHHNGLNEPPARLCCGQRHWGPVCPDRTFMCQQCFRKCQLDEAWEDEEGQRWDICDVCGNGGDGNPDLGKDLALWYDDHPDEQDLPDEL